jgi:hypothetical protein
MTQQEFNALKPGDIVKHARVDMYFILAHDPAFDDYDGHRRAVDLLVCLDPKYKDAAENTSYVWWPPDWTLIHIVCSSD